jgi:hypothetical protein
VEQRHQPAEATRSRQAGSGSSNGRSGPDLGSRSASLSLQGCSIQTTCSSASDVEVQLGGREETEGFCLPLNYRYREYEVSSSRWVQHTVKQRADGSVQKVEEATDCVHASRTGTPSPAGCLLNTHATRKASPLLPGSCSKERMRRLASGLRLGSPKDLGLLFIRPHETCSCCSLPEQAESLELCQLRASSLQWVRAHLPCAGARGPGGLPSAALHLFSLRSSLFRRSTRPCWPCCGRGRCWAAGPQGMAIPGIARRVEPLGPLGDGAAGGCGKTCREQAWLPSWQPTPRPPSRPAIPPPPPGPVVGNARQTPHGFLDRSAIIPQPAAMLSGFATPNPNCGRHSLGGG